MSMREKIARAIDPDAFSDWQISFDYEMQQSGDKEEARRFADWGHSLKRAYERADAVLDALMEPTELMIYEGEGYCDFVLPAGFDNSGEGRRREFRMGFCSAIRAAKEGK